jgi:hypothetical protein
MINLRYHVYSLVAVFLALAIGVAAGSTVVQRSVVDNLKSTQGRIEKNLDDLEAQNAALADRTAALEDRAGALSEQGPAALLGGDLDGVPVVILRTEGMSGDALQRVRDALKVSGADVVADVEVRQAMTDPDALAVVSPDLGLSPDERQPEQVQTALAERLAGYLLTLRDEGAPETSSDDTTPTTEPAPSESATEAADFLRSLDDAGLVSVRGPLGDSGVNTEGLKVLLLGGMTKDFDPAAVYRPLLDVLADGRRPIALAADAALDHPLQDGEEAFGMVDAVRGSGRLRDRISTVDDLGDFAGVTAVVLGLANLADRQVGHYGVADGADSLLPTRRP